MSEDSPRSSPEPNSENDDDPLTITETDIKLANDDESAEATKRKSEPDSEPDNLIKKQKIDDNGTTEDSEIQDEVEPEKPSSTPEIVDSENVIETAAINDDETESMKVEKDLSEKEEDAQAIDEPEKGSGGGGTDKKKEKNDSRKVQNLRKNIKDVIDDKQLDATTLDAQRQESERLARVQEQQRLIRERQYQMQANKTQQKVLSLLQGENSGATDDSALDFDGPILEKLNLTSSITQLHAPTALESLISTDDHIPDSEEGDDDDDTSDDDDVVIQPYQQAKPVVIDSSSDSDDCVILSDEEEEEIEDDDEGNSGEHTNDTYNRKDEEGRVVINIGHGEKEQNIYVAPQIARIIKPHQIGGVRFLFDNIIESVELFDKSSGFGCILAHSMGLGKTLQLVCFCDIFLRHTKSKSILIIMPINTLQNWLHEFNMWTPLPEDADKSPLKKDGEVRPRQFNIFVLNDSQKTLTARANTVLEWSKQGGVLMMGYEMYRLLSQKKLKKKRCKGNLFGDDTLSRADQQMFDNINQALVNPGPDLVVCDEGHRIKNAHASTSIALKQIKSKRRVVLTGYPLQNNLLEYWCMVDFVRPSYLGTKTEFSNMFERPIQNGQCIDSTPQDCKLMRYRAHVLHSLLKGFVQRRSQAVLQKSLPEKTEFVMLFRMTEFQRKLYTVFMNEVVRSKKVPNPLKAFSVCCKIWNHPDVLYNFLKKRETDLDLELEDTETVKAEAKKRGRKAKDLKKDLKKDSTEDEVKPPVAKNLNSTSSSSDSFKAPMNSSLSNEQEFSPMCNSVESASSGSFASYQSYQSFDSNGANRYDQSWTGGNYWQNNYYQSNDYQHQGSGFGGAGGHQNSYQPYYGNSNYPKALTDDKVTNQHEPTFDDKKKKVPIDGGLLADVIKEEKLTNDLKFDYDKKESKNARDDGIPYDWAVELMKDYVPGLLENSPKLNVFFTILNESVKLGDRMLIFSQSLLTLNILENFLHKYKVPNTDTFWAKNTNYFRLDGTTAALEREKLINEFNATDKVKLFLVSTRAGSLGINLVGANRVVVFDASWNPCHDTQAVCRVYRYGQSKACSVYRFVMDNCLEKKIYDRQINKQGMADRIVDECNPDAHLSMREVTSLCYDDGVDPEVSDFSSEIDKYDDMVARKLLELHAGSLTKEPFQHESLLVDRKEKKLSQAEKRLAQRGYELEKQAATKATFNYNSVGTNYRAFRTTDGSLIHRPVGQQRPEPTEMNDAATFARAQNPRPNRWVPVEVWQSKGLTAQEMTLPQDVSIQTNSNDKSKIFLKAGQKVIVLKSPKGICLQLESGKVIAIRASVKNGPSAPGTESKSESFQPSQPSSSSQNNGFRPFAAPPQTSNDIIDISNDDDEDDGNKAPTVSSSMTMDDTSKNGSQDMAYLKPSDASDQPAFKDKTIYKPNLVKRKPKVFPIVPAPIENQSQPLRPFDYKGYQSQRKPSPPDWSARQNYPQNPQPHALPPIHKKPMAINGVSEDRTTHSNQGPYAGPDYQPKIDEMRQDGQMSKHSAFHSPSTDPYVASQYPPQQTMYPSYSNYPQAPPPPPNNYNYPYHNYSNPPAGYGHHYPNQGTYDPNLSSYHVGYSTMNYNPITPKHSYPLPINPDAPIQVSQTSPPSTEWNYNN